jgi:chromosome segregation ATPase
MEREARAQASEKRNLLHQAQRHSDKNLDKVAKLNTDLYKLKEDLASKLALIREKNAQLTVLEKKLKEWEKQLRENKVYYENELEGMTSQLHQLQYQSTLSEDQQRKDIKNFKEALQQKRVELSDLQDRLMFTELKLKERESELKKKDAEIASLKISLVTLEREVVLLQDNIKLAGGKSVDLPQQQPITPRQEDDVAFIKRQDRLIAQLKDRLLQLQGELQRQKHMASQNRAADIPDYDHRLTALEQELVSLKSRLQEREDLLAKRNNEYQVLVERLKDTQERLEAVDGIMENKNRQIKELEGQITEILSQFEQNEMSDLKQ